MNEGSNKFFDEMAEDFFAECDELLSVIKRDLFKLDNLMDQPADRVIIEELLRSCHTLKGLTGMVGADETMKLTHSIESYLKALNKGELSITREALDVIFRSIAMVESHVNALREKADLPDSAAVRKEVEKLVVKGDSTGGKKNVLVDADSGKSRVDDEKIWLFSFKPSHELFNKGININDIRKRINDLGRVISSKPKTDEAGRITFEFLVATTKPESSFAQWTSEGITYELKDEIPQNGPTGALITGEAAKTDTGNVKLKNIVRVDITRLDNIMRSVGDLVISRSRLNENLKNMRPARDYDFDSLLEINVKMERQIRELRDGIMKLRLVNTGEAFERLRFVVRDLIKKSDKKIHLQFEGQETLIDKYVMDRMFDPLLHLVRNSVSHGIETPHERIAAGKPGQGLLFIKASASGNDVIFEISDDGNGIDRELIRRKAQNMGIKKGHEPTDTELLDILCLPGFTTREKTDMSSGRGVGMEIVKKAIDEIGGSMILQSKKGIGTKFIIHLPLTLSIVDALIISAGKSHFALPMPFVSEIIKIDPLDIISFQEHKMISYRDMAIPLLELHRFFNINNEGRAPEIALIIDHSPGKVGILINRIIGQREIVVRSLADPIVKVDGISGVTDPGDGRALLILDVHSLIRSAFKNNQFAEEIYQHNEDGKERG